MRHGRALHRRYGRATLASGGTFARPGQLVRYVGPVMHLAGMEGRVVAPVGAEDPHTALVQWAAHDRAVRQKGESAHWDHEWVRHDYLKPLKKLTKGFAFYKVVRGSVGPGQYAHEGVRTWVRE